MFRIFLLIFPLLLSAHPYNNSLSERLFSKLYKPNENTLFSPYSIQNSLLLLHEGSTRLCEYELRRFLQLDSHDEDLSKLQERLSDAKFLSANALWTHSSLQISETFRANERIESLNLNNPKIASFRIEEWASTKSKKKFLHFLQDYTLKSTSHALLTDVASLKCSWKYPFRTKDTLEELFYSKEKIAQKFMCQTAQHLFYEDETCKIVSLPLENDLTCLFYMPIKNELSLPPKALLQKMKETKVYVQIPKFNIQQRTQLNQPLMALGMTKPFFRGAEFSNICPTTPFYISEMLHQSGLSINEWGVDASPSLFALSRDYKPPTRDATHHFIANRPFLYLILDSKEDIILFLGTYCHP